MNEKKIDPSSSSKESLLTELLDFSALAEKKTSYGGILKRAVGAFLNFLWKFTAGFITEANYSDYKKKKETIEMLLIKMGDFANHTQKEQFKRTFASLNVFQLLNLYEHLDAHIFLISYFLKLPKRDLPQALINISFMNKTLLDGIGEKIDEDSMDEQSARFLFLVMHQDLSLESFLFLHSFFKTFSNVFIFEMDSTIITLKKMIEENDVENSKKIKDFITNTVPIFVSGKLNDKDLKTAISDKDFENLKALYPDFLENIVQLCIHKKAFDSDQKQV